eukprot:CAMPEP_0181038904 /NCGR_PEP_ID=MMETSP1070-20121207/10178_1 /TAXON_ID=265543 /ORGANISM="Minutocellus polymorphus, Strain NH13" /LENGTH=589 /DNA_ID=CAMNT_0023116707 /DNA_START=52 /DNA_END=1821 /DNA_ORIENTATION=-
MSNNTEGETPAVAAVAEPEAAAAATEPAADGSTDNDKATTATDADGAAAGGGDKKKKGDNKGGSKRRDRKDHPKDPRDETPIEELYDLTQPIPFVARPSKDEHEAEVAALNVQIEGLKDDRQKLQDQIDAAMGKGGDGKGGKGGKGGNPAADALKDELKTHRTTKGTLIDDKKALRLNLDAIRTQSDKLAAERKTARSAVGSHSTLAAIETEIARLHKRQETTSMTLAAEKRLIKDIDSLEASKKTVAAIQTKDDELNAMRDEKKAVQTQLTDKDREIDAVQKIIETKSAALKVIYDKEAGTRADLNKLFAAKDEIRGKMNEIITERNALRDAYRQANNDWYHCQRAIRAQKQLKYDEEKAARDAEKLAWAKAREEEEAKKIPYEEEMALCDYLADYLTRTYLVDAAEEKKKREAEAAEKKRAAEGVVAVRDEDNPFANFKPAKKGGDDEVFLQMGKGKSKRNRNKSGKAGGKAAKSKAAFTLSVDSFEQFGLLGLTPPTSADAVENSVTELRERKVWYSTQERGAVKTAQEIRKDNEKYVAKIQAGKGGGSGGKGGSGGNKKGGGKQEVVLGPGSGSAPLAGQWAART